MASTAQIAQAAGEDERQLRIDLAAFYRIVAMLGWDEYIFTHISLRIPGPEKHFLINPFGMLYEEVRASDLVRIDIDGNIVGASAWPSDGAPATAPVRRQAISR